jgi:hypothetical protein
VLIYNGKKVLYLLNIKHSRSMHNVSLALAHNRREENLLLVKITMVMMMSWFVFNVMEYINGM